MHGSSGYFHLPFRSSQKKSNLPEVPVSIFDSRRYWKCLARHTQIGAVVCLLALPFQMQGQAAVGSVTTQSTVQPHKRAIGPHSADPVEAKFQRDSSDLLNDDAAARDKRDTQWRNTTAPNTLIDPGTEGGLGGESTNVTHMDYVGNGREALPIKNSELIAIGSVVSSRGFVTPDKTGVYTETTIRLTTVLKGTASRATVTGISAGGNVVFPSGHKKKVVFDGIGYPKAGGVYLFFLHQMPKTNSDFGILTAYELTGSSVLALDNESSFTQYEGMNQTSFLNKVQALISSGGQLP